MAHFDRFDISEAYLVLHDSWHAGGEFWGRRQNIPAQLQRIGFRRSPLFSGFVSLTENGKEIYAQLCERFGLPDTDVEQWETEEG